GLGPGAGGRGQSGDREEKRVLFSAQERCATSGEVVEDELHPERPVDSFLSDLRRQAAFGAPADVAREASEPPCQGERSSPFRGLEGVEVAGPRERAAGGEEAPPPTPHRGIPPAPPQQPPTPP